MIAQSAACVAWRSIGVEPPWLAVTTGRHEASQSIFRVAMMKAAVLAIPLVMLLGLGNRVAAHDDRHHHEWRRWWGDERKEEFRDGPCKVKIDSKRGEYKREVKCKDGVGARWHGEWKEEFRDGECWVKQEAKRDEFKEEVKCDQYD